MLIITDGCFFYYDMLKIRAAWCVRGTKSCLCLSQSAGNLTLIHMVCSKVETVICWCCSLWISIFSLWSSVGFFCLCLNAQTGRNQGGYVPTWGKLSFYWWMLRYAPFAWLFDEIFCIYFPCRLTVSRTVGRCGKPSPCLHQNHEISPGLFWLYWFWVLIFLLNLLLINSPCSDLSRGGWMRFLFCRF